MVGVLVVNDRPHRLYGMQRTTIEIAEILESAGMPACYCTVGSGPALDEAKGRGLRTRQLDASPNLAAFDKSVSLSGWTAKIATGQEIVALSRAVAQAATAENCDIIFLATNRLGMLAPLLRKKGRHIVVYGQNTIPLGWRAIPSVVGAHALPQMSPAARNAYPSALRRLFRKKFPLVPLGIDLANFASIESLERPSEVTLISVAKISERKGIHTILSAVSALRETGRDVRLILVGGPGTEQDERYMARLQSEFPNAEWVEWVGYSDNVSAHLGRAHIGVIASDHEGGPRVLFEMMAAGLVVCSTAVGYVPEVLEHGLDGLVLRDPSKKSFFEALATLVDDQNKRSRMAASAKEKAALKYSVDVFAQQLTDLLMNGSTHAQT